MWCLNFCQNQSEIDHRMSVILYCPKSSILFYFNDPVRSISSNTAVLAATWLTIASCSLLLFILSYSPDWISKISKVNFQPWHFSRDTVPHIGFISFIMYYFSSCLAFRTRQKMSLYNGASSHYATRVRQLIFILYFYYFFHFCWYYF